MKPLRNGMLTIAALALAGIFFLSLAPIALASNTWYVDGVSGSDSNTCMLSESACKTIGHAISLASWGDSIVVAAATYTENLYITFNLNLIGSGANTTIIDGGHAGSGRNSQLLPCQNFRLHHSQRGCHVRRGHLQQCAAHH